MNEVIFKNKVVVVTGAASGIGLAICRKFASAGANIALLDMDNEALSACEQEFADNGYKAIAIPCDVTKQEECESAMERVIADFGGIDVLVNNAGITQRGAFVDTHISVYRKVMEVNFFGSLYCTKAAIQSLIQRKGLIIVNESMAGIAPLLGRTGYSASKHALHGMFTSLRTEVKDKGVHVLIVCPGFIKTNLQSRALGYDGSVTDHPQSTIGKQDTPEHAAEEIYKAAVKRKYMLVLTPVGKIGYLLSRLFPIFYERVMAHKLKSELVDQEF